MAPLTVRIFGTELEHGSDRHSTFDFKEQQISDLGFFDGLYFASFGWMGPENDITLGQIVNEVFVEYLELSNGEILVNFIEIFEDKIFGEGLEIVELVSKDKEFGIVFKINLLGKSSLNFDNNVPGKKDLRFIFLETFGQ